MKRIVLIAIVILFCLTLRAQSVTYTCRYWFDQNDAQAVTTAFNGNIWQAELDVGTLTEGMHTLHVQAADTSSAWCSPLSYMFLKLSPTESLLDPVDMSNLTYRCWFDQDHAHQQIGALGNGVFLFDVSELEEGLHSVNILLEGSMLTSTQSYMFVKVTQQEHLIDPIDMSHLAYHCWYDQDYENHVTDSVSNGIIQLDLDNIADGLHTVHIMLEGEALTSILSYVFVKVSQQNSLIEPIDMSNLVYHCWFDQDYENNVVAPMSNGILLLDVDNVSDGLHSVHILLEGEAMTSTLTYMFMKKPQQEDFGIAKWQYYLNGDVSQIHTTEISPVVDTLDIITLLPVETWPVRSSCFHFHPNGDEPYLNAKNEVIFRFWTNDDRVLEKSAFYVDYQVQQNITAEVFERNTTETFTAPRNNQIQWFKVEANIGDSLAFVADKACTMQLFAPSGEEVYAATASEAMELGGCHAWEDGMYYLAVHDVTASGEMIEVTYNHLEKYVVLAYSPEEIGNTWGVFDVDVLGNGFDKLSNVILMDGSIEWQMDTVIDRHISQAAIRFAIDSTTNNGNYDLVLCFEDYDGELDTLVLPNAIQVVEAQFGTIEIVNNYQFNTTPPYLITVTVTNNGNVEYQGVPVLFAYSNENNVRIGLYKDWITVQDDYFENGGEAVYHTNNLFNQGIEGNIIPLIIPKLGPYRTREIELIVDAENGTDFGFYAWGGIPWSLKTTEAYNADNNYCQTHTGSLGWGNSNGNGSGLGNGVIGGGSVGGSSGMSAALFDAGGSFGGANYSIGAPNALGGNTHGAASDAFSDSCDGLPDPCDMVGDVLEDTYECICGLVMGNGLTLGNMLNAMEGLNHRAQLEGVGITSQEEAEEYGLGGMWESAYNRKLQTPGSLLRGAIEHCTGLLPDDAQQMADDALEGMKNDGCPHPQPQHPLIPMPSDPNDIRGYLSESGSHHMRQEIQNVQYEIEFENDTTLATAAAHTIIVRDTLDATKFDLNSLAARSVTIGDKRLELNGEQTFARTLDLRPELYVIAQINQDYDPTTGIVEWTIQSLDPMTMEPTNNPYQGVLPVNYYGDGVGFIDYSINLKQAFADGTAISNRAGIIFDQEEVIMTPTWTNIVDAVKPTSHIEEVTFEDDTLNFSFISSDNRSGVWYHSLYYRNDSTYQEWQVKVPRIFENSYMLRFNEYQTTEYLVMAVDSAGNVEDKEMVAEYVYYYVGPAPTCQSIDLALGWNWFSTYLDITLDDLKTALVEAMPGSDISIKSQTQNISYNPNNHRWLGTLAWDVAKMYAIKTSIPCEITLIGTPLNPSEHPITILNGANWIGFPFNASMTLANAFAGFAVNGDKIKSQTNNALYNGIRWQGQLNALDSGKGYIYISNSLEERTLTFPTIAK